MSVMDGFLYVKALVGKFVIVTVIVSCFYIFESETKTNYLQFKL